MKKLKKISISSLKLCISLLLLSLVFRKIPFSDAWNLIKACKPLFLVMALVAFIVSQVISSQRLLLYFYAEHFLIHKLDNLKLYLIGMFYNFFIPGGIGGDAYKVYILHKKFRWNSKKLAGIIFCDRFSGLLAIILLIEILIFLGLNSVLQWLIIPFAIITICIVKFFLIRYFPQFKKIFFQTLLYSLGVQILQLVSVYCILKSLMQTEGIWIYCVIFLISAILSIISFSGIGVREWLFMKAAQYFTFNSGVSVSSAMLFSFITAIVAFVGVYFYRFKYKTDIHQM